MRKLQSLSEKETKNIARKLALSFKGGEVIALEGELGTGKTVFIKGLAQGLGIKETIKSPSFVLMKVYPLKCRKIKYLCHVDAYRLAKAQELLDIGLNDWLSKEGVVTVIEWADKVREVLPKKSIKIRLNYGKKENERTIRINF